MKSLIILAFLLLAGCQTAQQAATEQQIALDDAKCRSYGVEPGSKPYIDCRMNLEQSRAVQNLGAGTSPLRRLVFGQ